MRSPPRSIGSLIASLVVLALSTFARESSAAGIVWTVKGSQPHAVALTACYDTATGAYDLFQLSDKGTIAVNRLAGADRGWFGVTGIPETTPGGRIGCIDNGLVWMAPSGRIYRYDGVSDRWSDPIVFGAVAVTAARGYASLGFPDYVDTLYSFDSSGNVRWRPWSGSWTTLAPAASTPLFDLGIVGDGHKGTLVALTTARTGPMDDGVRTFTLRPCPSGTVCPAGAWTADWRDPSSLMPVAPIHAIADAGGAYFAVDGAGTILRGEYAMVASLIAP